MKFDLDESKTRDNGLLASEDGIIPRSFVLTQYRRVMVVRSDRRTDGQKFYS